MANSLSILSVSSLLLAAAANAGTLAPANDILFPSTSNSQNPLIYSGGNTPWYAGPNVNGISNSVPKTCSVQQAAYVVRHGSRYDAQ